MTIFRGSVWIITCTICVHYDEHLHLFPRLRENPARLMELRKQWDYWLALPGFSCNPAYSEAWLKAIDEGLEAVERLILDEGDNGQVLRSCSPFGVLWSSPVERWDYLRWWNKEKMPEYIKTRKPEYLQNTTKHVIF